MEASKLEKMASAAKPNFTNREFMNCILTLQNLQIVERYENICNEIVQLFATNQELDFDGWVGDNIGGIASFACPYFFNMDDMVLDLKTNQKKGFILEWQNEGTDYAIRKGDYKYINYKSYIMGFRHPHLEKQIK